MELMDYLTTRRSIRRYQDRPIPTEVMEELIRIATLAPTGSGEQPWGFWCWTTRKKSTLSAKPSRSG